MVMGIRPPTIKNHLFRHIFIKYFHDSVNYVQTPKSQKLTKVNQVGDFCTEGRPCALPIIFHLQFLIINIRKELGSLQNKQMSSTPTSQISLMRVYSNQPKCWVFFEGGDKLQKYQLSVDESTTVSGLICTVITLIKDHILTIDYSSKDCLFELYASRKNGRKVSDLPSLEEKQTVLKTGIKFFVLQNNAKQAKSKRISTVSTKSIQSEMKETPIKSTEVTANKNVGCFCF